MAFTQSHFSKCSPWVIHNPEPKCLGEDTLPEAVLSGEQDWSPVCQLRLLWSSGQVSGSRGPSSTLCLAPPPGPWSPTLKLCGLNPPNPPRPHTCLTSFPISPLQVGPCGFSADFLSQNRRTGAHRRGASGGLGEEGFWLLL